MVDSRSPRAHQCPGIDDHLEGCAVFSRVSVKGIVLIQMDNTPVMAYLRNFGGMFSPSLDQWARLVTRWCMQRIPLLSSVHVARADHVLAIALFRPYQLVVCDCMKTVAWELNQRVANHLFRKWGTPMVDLFAMQGNRKVLTFCSRLTEPLAVRRDSMLMPWTLGLYYIYLTPFLILPALAKIRRAVAELIAIIP